MKIKEIIIRIFNSIENVPFYWVGIFTGLLLLIISILVTNSIPYNNVTYFGGENGSTGIALAQGRGFSDPFLTGSGATAWVSPLLPAILGIIFYITNFNLTAAYWITLSLKVLSFGFGASLIWDILQKSNRRFALICYIWMGVLCYLNKELLIYNFHDEWLVFLIISLAFWAWHKQSEFIGQIVLIMAFVMAALSSPILWLVLFIVTLIFRSNTFCNIICKSRISQSKNLFSPNLFWIAVTVSLVIIIGWTLRNWIHLEMFAPIKSNGGYEIFQTQVVSKNGVLNTSVFIDHPHNLASKENKAYKKLGEAEFIISHREVALRSIANDPCDYLWRVKQRFSNAFLFTVSHFNFDDIDPKISNDDLEKLQNAGLVKYFFNRKVWVNLDNPDNNAIRMLSSLRLNNQKLIENNYKITLIRYYNYLYSCNRIIGGLLMGGMPWLAFLLAIFMRRYSELYSYVFWAGFFIVLYLLPYVLISHYLRYQVPLLGMHAILLTSGTIAIFKSIKEWSIFKRQN